MENRWVERCCSTTILLPWSHTRNASQQLCLLFSNSACTLVPHVRALMQQRYNTAVYFPEWETSRKISILSHTGSKTLQTTPVKRSDDKTLQNTGCVCCTLNVSGIRLTPSPWSNPWTSRYHMDCGRTETPSPSLWPWLKCRRARHHGAAQQPIV